MCIYICICPEGEGKYKATILYTVQYKDTGGYQHSGGYSRNLSFNGLKQREIELEEGSARVSWYETQLLIGQPNGGSPKFQGVSPKFQGVSPKLFYISLQTKPS